MEESTFIDGDPPRSARIAAVFSRDQAGTSSDGRGLTGGIGRAGEANDEHNVGRMCEGLVQSESAMRQLTVYNSSTALLQGLPSLEKRLANS